VVDFVALPPPLPPFASAGVALIRDRLIKIAINALVAFMGLLHILLYFTIRLFATKFYQNLSVLVFGRFLVNILGGVGIIKYLPIIVI